MKKKLHPKFRFILNLLILTAGILLFFLVVQVSGKSFLALLKQTAHVKYHYLAAVTATAILLSALLAKRWSLLMSGYTDIQALPKGFIFYNTNIGFMITSFLPVLGHMGTKAASFKLEHGVAIRKTVNAAFIEYLLGFAVIIAMLIPSGLYIAGVFNLTQGLIGIGIITVLLVFGFSHFSRILLDAFGSFYIYLARKLSRAPLVRNLGFVQRFTPEGFAAIDKVTSSKVIILSLLAYYTILVRGFIFLKAFNIQVNLGEFVMLHVLGYTLSSLGLTPANIGVSELSWFGVLTLIGAGPEHAALYAVGQRLINTGTIIGLTAVSYVFYVVSRHSDRKRLALKPLTGNRPGKIPGRIEE